LHVEIRQHIKLSYYYSIHASSGLLFAEFQYPVFILHILWTMHHDILV